MSEPQRDPRFIIVVLTMVVVAWLLVGKGRTGGKGAFMGSDYPQRQIVEEYMARVESARGNSFTPAQRARIHEVARSEFGRMAFKILDDAEPDDRDRRLDGLIRMALLARGETVPAPGEITPGVLRQTPDEELTSVLYDFICTHFSRTGAYQRGRDRDAVLKLPRGLRVVYLLRALDGEVYNGGFAQFFSNSSGQFVQETLEDCRLVGAERHEALLQQALDVRESSAVRTAMSKLEEIRDERERRREATRLREIEVQPALDRLDTAYYELEKVESLDPLIVRYLRAHPEGCLTKGAGDTQR